MTSTPQSPLDNPEIIPVLRPLAPIPQHDSSEIAQPSLQRPSNHAAHRPRLHVAPARTTRARRRTDVQPRSGPEIVGPRFERVEETGLADVALAVVVELHEYEIHLLHRVEGDAGVRTRALRCRGDVVVAAGRHLLAQGGHESGVVGRRMIFVVCVEMVVISQCFFLLRGVKAAQTRHPR